VLLDVMDLSGVFCVADSGVLQDTFLWNSMGMHTCSVWFSNTIHSKQCTMLWHVDDLKISHVNNRAVDEIIVKLNQRYGKEAPLMVTRVKVRDYLDMVIDFNVPNKVVICMDEYLDSILAEARDDMDGRSLLAAEHLFGTLTTH